MLTNTAIQNAKPKGKLYRMADAHGLCLEVATSGSKLWRFRYRFEGKAKMLALGKYPEVSLVKARELRDAARKLLAQKIDPVQDRKQGEVQKKAGEETFQTVAYDWHERNRAKWTPRHAERIMQRLSADVFPWLGPRPIREIEAPELLAVIRRIEQRGAVDVAHRCLQTCSQVFRFAVSCGVAERDVAADLRGALTPRKEQHHPALTDPKTVGQLLRAIEGYTGTFVTHCALRLAPLLFVRPGELRHAEWKEFDLELGEWRIPAAKTKMRTEHVVPLSRQSVEILWELRPLTGNGRYVFPGVRTADRPMSENTVGAALRRMGYTPEEMTGHGFRSTASTLLNEMGWAPDVIEAQLAHVERNKVRGAYNRAEYLPERRKMMQAWADYLDGLRTGARVIPLHGRQAQV